MVYCNRQNVLIAVQLHQSSAEERAAGQIKLLQQWLDFLLHYFGWIYGREVPAIYNRKAERRGRRDQPHRLSISRDKPGAQHLMTLNNGFKAGPQGFLVQCAMEPQYQPQATRTIEERQSLRIAHVSLPHQLLRK